MLLRAWNFLVSFADYDKLRLIFFFYFVNVFSHNTYSFVKYKRGKNFENFYLYSPAALFETIDHKTFSYFSKNSLIISAKSVKILTIVQARGQVQYDVLKLPEGTGNQKGIEKNSRIISVIIILHHRHSRWIKV